MATDSFSYTVADDWGTRNATVTVTINPGATLFVTASDDSESTPPGTAIDIPVLANDTASASLLPLQIEPGSVTSPSPSGTAAIITGNQIRYTPATGAQNLQATFTYRAKPSTAATPTATATVRVTVLPTQGTSGFLPENPDVVKASYNGNTYYVAPNGSGISTNTNAPGNYITTIGGVVDGSKIIFKPGNYGKGTYTLNATVINPMAGQKGRVMLLAQNPVFTDIDVTKGPGAQPLIGFNPANAALHSVITDNLCLHHRGIWMEGFRFGSTDLTNGGDDLGNNTANIHERTATGRMTMSGTSTTTGQRNWYVKNFHNRSFGKALLIGDFFHKYVVYKNYIHGGVRTVGIGGFRTDYFIFMNGNITEAHIVGNYFRGGANQTIALKDSCDNIFIQNNTWDNTIFVSNLSSNETGGSQIFNGQAPDKINNDKTIGTTTITNNTFYKAGSGRAIACGNGQIVMIRDNNFNRIGGGGVTLVNFDIWSAEAGNTMIGPRHPTQWTVRNNNITGTGWVWTFGLPYVTGTNVLIENNTGPLNYGSEFSPDGGLDGGGTSFNRTAKLQVHIGPNSRCDPSAAGNNIALV